MRSVIKIVCDIKEILNNAERTQECGGDELVKIDELVDEIIKVTSYIGYNPQQTGWIPCDSGQMPEDGKNVLVWFEYYRYGRYNRLYQTHGISYTYEGKWSGCVNGESGWQQLRIIAWMPLPEVYKPET